MLLSESFVKSTFKRNTALITLDSCSYKNFTIFMYLFVTPVSLKMTEALTNNFKLTNDKNEVESANQI